MNVTMIIVTYFELELRLELEQLELELSSRRYHYNRALVSRCTM
jgi:hypothetical protein